MIKEINVKESSCPWFAKADIAERAAAALKADPAFFKNPAHIGKVETVEQIVINFFGPSKGVYVTPRLNKGKPFTSVKVDNPVFPNNLSTKKRKEIFYDPLAAMGVEIIYSKNTNSYLFRVR
jgi:hypothetical protein